MCGIKCYGFLLIHCVLLSLFIPTCICVVDRNKRTISSLVNTTRVLFDCNLIESAYKLVLRKANGQTISITSCDPRNLSATTNVTDRSASNKNEKRGEGKIIFLPPHSPLQSFLEHNKYFPKKF